MTTYYLPQNDPAPAVRTAALAVMQQKYGYTMTYGVPTSTLNDKLLDNAGPEWLAELVKALIGVRYDVYYYVKSSSYKFATPVPPPITDPTIFVGWLNAAAKQSSYSSAAYSYFSPNVGYGKSYNRPTSTDDFKAIFTTTTVPAVVATFDTDVAFARTFLAGPNPIPLTRMTQVPAAFPISDTQFSTVSAFAGDSLNQALQDGRVFYCDHSDLAALATGSYNSDVPKYAYAPWMAFAVPRGGGAMLPFAIQCGPTPQGRRIYTPADGYSWRLARNCALVGHNIHHQNASHLGLTHLLIEPIAVSTRRNLALLHPVYALLKHHLEGTININNGGTHFLILPGNQFDQMLGPPIASALTVMVAQRLNYSFTGNYPPARFARQGTDQTTWLSDYPYRDDGLLIWNAIGKWMQDFVACFYASDGDVQADSELQTWAGEIASPSIGMVKDFGATPGSVQSRPDLAQILTMIIFTASAQHAAVNFSQGTDMTFAPANPLAGYTPEPQGLGHTQQDYIANLPPLEVGLSQFELFALLGAVHYKTLGNYSGLPVTLNGVSSDFTTGPVAGALANFQASLLAIEQQIQKRNTQRTPYIHLLPSRIPQSTNI